MERVTSTTRWPEHGLERVERCPVCGSPDRATLYERLWDRVFFCAPGEWTLHRCTNCGSAYLDPRPTQETIGLAYSRYYTHTAQWREDASKLGPVRRFLRALSNGYFNRRFGTSFEPASALGPLLARVAPVRRGDLEAVGRHLRKLSGIGNLLDVGCGSGVFLQFARSAGWQVNGVDPDPKAVEHCRQNGLKVDCGSIEDHARDSESFDVITVSHVIEHVRDPLNLLRHCHRLLKRKGLLWIETPNLGSLGHRLYGRNWIGLDPPRHLVLFNHATLKAILMEAGFVEVRLLPLKSAFDSFLKSESIAEGRDPFSLRPSSLALRCRAWRADWLARRDPFLRDVVTFQAVKDR